jgi:uncharacterized protein YbjT (DUF2867 family)
MKAILFGATGMIGQGVLRECLADSEVTQVMTVSRSPLGQSHPLLRQGFGGQAKLIELIHKNFEDFSPLEKDFKGYDACFFCLGVPSAGMSETDYRRMTRDFAVAAATTLSKVNPGMTFVFISGAGTDSTEKGPIMWARVKGEAENAILKMPFKASYVFRPGIIQPLDGIVSRVKLYRIFYTVTGPIMPLLKWLFPKYVTTTRLLAQAMIKVARDGAPKRILESSDFDQLAGK